MSATPPCTNLLTVGLALLATAGGCADAAGPPCLERCDEACPSDPCRTNGSRPGEEADGGPRRAAVDAGAGDASPPSRGPVGACGDRVLDRFEQCDDGNTASGDGCSSVCQIEGEDFPVRVYEPSDPPPAPALEALPLASRVTRHGITWTFASPARVGRFVNGDYYVVGNVTVTAISPAPTASNGRHGSMLNVAPNLQRSGFDARTQGGRYDASLRVVPPIALTPGNELVSSRSAEAPSAIARVMRPGDKSVSPVASISILTSVTTPQPLDAFRPSYAKGQGAVYRSSQLDRGILPKLAPVESAPPAAEFAGYFGRPWVDAVFFGFDAPAEYMPDYGREVGYVSSFASLLLTLDVRPEEKEPLLVGFVQYAIDIYGLVRAGHAGWQGHGGHGSGRKLPILVAGALFGDAGMKSVSASFGEDIQTMYVTETPPAGSYTRSWHRVSQAAVYAGHVGNGASSSQPGWGPFEHLAPAEWRSTFGADVLLGETYRRCCTSAAWVGEALAARLIPGVQAAWAHPAFFDYVDRWMTPDDPADVQAIASATGTTFRGDFGQGQASGILSGGGYDADKSRFVDRMWRAYRR